MLNNNDYSDICLIENAQDDDVYARYSIQQQHTDYSTSSSSSKMSLQSDNNLTIDTDNAERVCNYQKPSTKKNIKFLKLKGELFGAAICNYGKRKFILYVQRTHVVYLNNNIGCYKATSTVVQTPANRIGLCIGDELLYINGVDVQDLEMGKISNLIKTQDEIVIDIIPCLQLTTAGDAYMSETEFDVSPLNFLGIKSYFNGKVEDTFDGDDQELLKDKAILSCNGQFLLDCKDDDAVVSFVNDSYIMHGRITLCLLPSRIAKSMLELCKTLDGKNENKYHVSSLQTFSYPNNPVDKVIKVKPGKKSSNVELNSKATKSYCDYKDQILMDRHVKQRQQRQRQQRQRRNNNTTNNTNTSNNNNNNNNNNNDNNNDDNNQRQQQHQGAFIVLSPPITTTTPCSSNNNNNRYREISLEKKTQKKVTIKKTKTKTKTKNIKHLSESGSGNVSERGASRRRTIKRILSI